LKKIAIPLIIVALGVGLYVAFGRSSAAKPDMRYVTAPVEKGILKAEINSSGTLRPMVEVLVGSQVSGTIKELYADFESVVKKGQLIALIDPDTYQAKMEQAKADLFASRATLARAIVTRDNELKNVERKKGLVAKGSVSQSDYDAQEAKTGEAVAQVDVENARVEQMKAKLNEAELQLRYTRIVAPVDGVVVARNMDVGQTVTASFQTPLLFKIAEDLTRMQVHTNVDEADIGRVRVGQKASFTVPAFPEENFHASVIQIRNDPKIEQNVVTYDVVLDVDNHELKLRPGMTADVHILLQEVADALIAPEQAFRFTPGKGTGMAEESKNLPPLGPGQRRAWKLEANNVLRPVTVKTGVIGMEKVQILSDELKPGDRLVMDAVPREAQEKKSQAIRFRF
jgi:HlyD family secretion protein